MQCPICLTTDACQVDPIFVCCKNSDKTIEHGGWKFIEQGVKGGLIWERIAGIPEDEKDRLNAEYQEQRKANAKAADLFEEFEKGFEELNLHAKRLLDIKDLEKRKFFARKLAYKLRIDLGAVDAAIQRERLAQRSKESPFVTLKELFQEPTPDTKMLIPEVLPRGDLMVLSGKPGDGKSLIAYEIAYQVLNGGKFAGNQIKKGKVLFIQLDERKGTYKQRIEGRGIDTDSEDFAIMRRFRLSDLSLLEEKLHDFRPDLIVIDNFRKAISGMGLDENKPEAADTLDPLIELLEDYDASCVLIHHDNKNTQAQGQDRMSGSTNLISKAFSGFRIIRASENPDNTKIYMQSVKMRDGEPKRFEFSYERGENWYYSFIGEQNVDNQALTMIERVANVITLNTQPALDKYEFSAGQIRELLMLHQTDKTIYTHLDRAEAKCIIKKRTEGTGKNRRTYYRLYDSPVSNFESTSESLNGSTHQSTEFLSESMSSVDSTSNHSNPLLVNGSTESIDEFTASKQIDATDFNVIQITDHPRFESIPSSPLDSPCRPTESLPVNGFEKNGSSLHQNSKNKTQPQQTPTQQHKHTEPTRDAKPRGKAFYNTGTSGITKVDVGGVTIEVGDKVIWKQPSEDLKANKSFYVHRLSRDRAFLIPGSVEVLLCEIELFVSDLG